MTGWRNSCPGRGRLTSDRLIEHGTFAWNFAGQPLLIPYGKAATNGLISAEKPAWRCYDLRIMPKPIRHCRRCRRILPPWSRLDTRWCGNACRQADHRDRHRWRRLKPGKAPIGRLVTVRSRAEQIAAIEAAEAELDATMARVMANVERIMKSGGATG